jgi:hypothetical protein
MIGIIVLMAIVADPIEVSADVRSIQEVNKKYVIRKSAELIEYYDYDDWILSTHKEKPEFSEPAQQKRQTSTLSASQNATVNRRATATICDK